EVLLDSEGHLPDQAGREVGGTALRGPHAEPPLDGRLLSGAVEAAIVEDAPPELPCLPARTPAGPGSPGLLRQEGHLPVLAGEEHAERERPVSVGQEGEAVGTGA